MGLLTDTQNCGLRKRQECRERFPTTDFNENRQLAIPACMSGPLTRGGGENVPGIPGACTTRKSAYLVRGTWLQHFVYSIYYCWEGNIPVSNIRTKNSNHTFHLETPLTVKNYLWSGHWQVIICIISVGCYYSAIPYIVLNVVPNCNEYSN